MSRSTLADFFLTFAEDLDKQHSNLQSEVNSFVTQVGELSAIVKKLKDNKRQLQETQNQLAVVQTNLQDTKNQLVQSQKEYLTQRQQIAHIAD